MRWQPIITVSTYARPIWKWRITSNCYLHLKWATSIQIMTILSDLPGRKQIRRMKLNEIISSQKTRWFARDGFQLPTPEWCVVSYAFFNAFLILMCVRIITILQSWQCITLLLFKTFSLPHIVTLIWFQSKLYIVITVSLPVLNALAHT